jgi:hypothetical protein
MADMMLKELEIETVLAVSLGRQLVQFLVLCLGMPVSIFCGEDLGMYQNMPNHGTLSLAARVSCLREHHIYNDSNARPSQIWTLTECGNANNFNIQDFH